MADRLDRLEHVMADHLEESGAIRQDIKWLKRMGYFLIGSPFAAEIIQHLWK